MRASVVQIVDMRAMVLAGHYRVVIARRMGCSAWLVRRHTKGLRSRAVTADQLGQREAARNRAMAYERIAAACNRALGLSFGGV